MPAQLPSWMQSPTITAPNWMDQAWQQDLRVTLPSFGQTANQMNAAPQGGPMISPPQSVSPQQQPAFDLSGLIKALQSPVSSGGASIPGSVAQAPTKAVGGWVGNDMWNNALTPRPGRWRPAWDPWGKPQSQDTT